MKPYYSRAGIDVLCARWEDVLPAMDAAAFDVAYADPCYAQTQLEWDRWTPGWVAAVSRVLKTPGALWCWGSLRMFMDRAEEFRCMKMAQDVVWEKNNGSGFQDDRFRRVHEQCVQFYQGPWGELRNEVPKIPYTKARKSAKHTANQAPHMGAHKDSSWARGPGDPVIMPSVIYSANCKGFAENETQKPIAACEPLHQFSARSGMHALSIFAGSGTDAELFFRRGLTAVVIECREQQCEVIAKRLSAMLPGMGG